RPAERRPAAARRDREGARHGTEAVAPRRDHERARPAARLRRDGLRARVRRHGVLPRRRRHPRGGAARGDLHEPEGAENARIPRAGARGGEARLTLLPRKRSSTPLAIGAFIAIPLFFSSLMASTLALEKPHTIQWVSGGRLLTTWHDPTQRN